MQIVCYDSAGTRISLDQEGLPARIPNVDKLKSRDDSL